MTIPSPARSGTEPMETLEAPVTAEIPSPLADGAHAPDEAVCFVCTGNTCRSPMAEAFMKSRGYKNAFSRGLSALEGAPISEGAVLALSDAGIAPTPDNDYRAHRAKNITETDLARADSIYCMTSSHAKMLMFYSPQSAGKIHVFPHDISDPYGGDAEAYKKAFVEISSALAEIFPVT